jgi:hypothetical protein
MSADDGMDVAEQGNERALAAMDGIDWKARALAAEHSVKVLTAQLENLRAVWGGEWTPWDRYAAAALTGLTARYGGDDLRLALWAGQWADNMMCERKEQAG